MIDLKKDKEYILKYNDSADKGHRKIITIVPIKVLHDKVQKTVITAIDISTFSEVTIDENSISDLTVINPVTNIELFTMYINYKNFVNPGPNQDLLYAKEVKRQIKTTLHEREYVSYGSGKLEAYDYSKMYEILDIDESKFKYKIGQLYKTLNNDEVKVLARTNLKGYECILCSDKRYRYDRSTNQHDSGRCTGTSWEFPSINNLRG